MEATEEKGGAKVKELFLDTKGSCFLCLKETEISNGYTGTTTMQEICVRNICKYLNINPSLILLQSLKERELTKEEVKEASAQRNQCDFSVMLCVQCSILATQLTKLIGELEMIEMNMNMRLHQFHKRLTTSEQEMDSQDQSRWEKFQKKMKTSENSVEARLVETLRNQTKTKCVIQLNKLLAASNPRVTLKRLQTNPKTAEPQLLPLLPPPIETASSENGSLETPYTKILSAIKTDAINKRKIMDIWSAQSQLVVSGGSRYKCKVCKQTYSQQNNYLSCHMMSHLEKIFLHPTLQNLGKEILSGIITSVLNNETKNSVRSVPPYQCFVCGRRCGQRCSLKQHLTLEHFSYVEKQLLNAVNLWQKRALSAASSGAPNACNSMPKSCQNLLLRKKNYTGGSPSIDRPPSTSTLNTTEIDAINKQKIIDLCATQFQLVASDENRYECKICHNMYSKDNTHYRFHHIIMRHPEKIFLHQTLQNLGKEKLLELVPSVLFAEAKNSVRNHCIYCGWGCSRRYDLKYHLVLEHFSYVEKQLLNAVNLKQNKTPFVPNSGALNKCNTKSKTRRNLTRSQHPLPFVCEVGKDGCGKRFTQKVSLIQHKRTCKVHTCNIEYGGCGKTFKNLFALRLHDCPMGTFKNPKPLLCNSNKTSTLPKKDIRTGVSIKAEPEPPTPTPIIDAVYSLKDSPETPSTSSPNATTTDIDATSGAANTINTKRSIEDNPQISLNVPEVLSSKKNFAQPFVCDTPNSGCGRRFKWEVNLRLHQKLTCKMTTANDSPKVASTSPHTDAISRQMTVNLCEAQFQPVALDGSRHECKICHQAYFREKKQLSAHVIRHHPEKIFLHQTLQNLGKDKLLGLVIRVLSVETKNSVKNRCVVCGWRYSRGLGVKYHLVLEHFSYVEKQLLHAVSVDQSRTLSGPRSKASNKCNSKPKTRQNLLLQKRKSFMFRRPSRNLSAPLPVRSKLAEIFARHAVPAEAPIRDKYHPQRGYHCGICSSSGRIYRKRELSKHLVNLHLDLFFAHKKGETVSEEKFTMHCRNVLMDTSCYSKVRSRVTKAAKYLCSFCRLRNHDTSELRYHFITEHYDILEGKVGHGMEVDLGEQNPGSTIISGEPIVPQEVEIEEENEEKPDIGEEAFFEIDVNSYPTTTEETVHREFNATMTGLNFNGLKNEQQFNAVNCWQDECPDETILPDL